MHLYTAAANQIGTIDARDLAMRIAGWHDSMVNHLRAVRTGVVRCDDECPHEQARVLWPAAVDVFGDHALRFTFLQSHGSPAPEAVLPVRRRASVR